MLMPHFQAPVCHIIPYIVSNRFIYIIVVILIIDVNVIIDVIDVIDVMF